ncbi:MAG TPA: PQQ-dependent sugar dehydrogenase [Steroidobacter sp.]|uniref:PQQ-dependent sugar dehydrogenase n=1 Tax=Steroidobacter sp. TaxID=1978227 RepID=UPI002ED967C2
MSDAHPPLWQRLAWYACGALLLLLLPVLKYAELWVALGRQQKLGLLVALGAFGGACLLSLLVDRTASWRAAGRSLVRSFAVLSLFLIGAAALSIVLPRYLLIPLVVVIALIVPLAISPVGLRRLPIAAIVVFTGVVSAYGFSHLEASSGVQRRTREVYLSTAYYPLRATIREGWIPEPETRGGSLTLLGDRILFATGDGHLYVIDAPADPAGFKIQELATRVPANREEFANAFGGSSRQPTRTADWRAQGAPKVQTWRFRVADIAAAVEGDDVRILASHHYWKAQEQCFVVRVSQLTTPLKNLQQAISGAQWSTLFESKPCIPLTGTDRKRGKNPFQGEEIGGRMLLLEGNKMLLTLGDFGFSGIESNQAFSQDPAADYGKTIMIDLATGQHSIYTMGHRNPQGITRSRDGKLWVAEHGPQGGDEINLLSEHANYGWPIVTYGTDYGSNAWPLSKHPGRHSDYPEPVLSWLPSPGVTDVTALSGELFPIWADNLLVGSLSSRSLYRLVLDEDRVVLQEPIALNKRVRDILQLQDGRILIWSDDWTLTLIEPASTLNGAGLFAAQCLGCHTIHDGLYHRLGPDLFGLFGRQVARAQGFEEYSPALRAQSGVWDAERLDRFLEQPQTAVPGTSMGFPGIPDAEQRKALIEYLQRNEPIDKRGTSAAK